MGDSWAGRVVIAFEAHAYTLRRSWVWVANSATRLGVLSFDFVFICGEGEGRVLVTVVSIPAHATIVRHAAYRLVRDITCYLFLANAFASSHFERNATSLVKN